MNLFWTQIRPGLLFSQLPLGDEKKTGYYSEKNRGNKKFPKEDNCNSDSNHTPWVNKA